MKSWYGRHVTAVMCAAVVICAAVVVVVVKESRSHSAPAQPAAAAAPLRYLGVYEPGSPHSYANVDRFTQAVGRSPNLVLYYSGWPERFKTAFAKPPRRTARPRSWKWIPRTYRWTASLTAPTTPTWCPTPARWPSSGNASSSVSVMK